MKLTKVQIKLLKFYAKYQTEPLTLFNIVRSFWLAWLSLLLAPAFGGLYIWMGLPALGWVFIGIGLGAFLRDLGRIQILFRTWLVLHEIINWERLKQFLQENEKAASNSSNSN